MFFFDPFIFSQVRYNPNYLKTLNSSTGGQKIRVLAYVIFAWKPFDAVCKCVNWCDL